jgi:hypothetical protein
MALGPGLRGRLRQFAGKSSSDGNLPKYAKPSTPISAFIPDLFSHRIRLGEPAGESEAVPAQPLQGAQNESTAFAESLRAVECTPGRKKALAIRRRSVQQA